MLLVGGAGRQLLWARWRALRQFAFVLIFALANAVISVVMYPTQVRYARTRWWLVDTELVLTVLAAALVAGAITQVGRLDLFAGRQRWFWRGAVAIATVFTFVQTIGFYWNGRYDLRDWNPSWNDHSYHAARWLARCVPADARVGSWNAGVLGYYALQPVTNLDGLINSFELIPYLRDGTTADYIRTKHLMYISDVGSAIKRSGILDSLPVRVVYRSYTPLVHQYYYIYQILPDPARAPQSEASAWAPAPACLQGALPSTRPLPLDPR